MAHPTLGPYIHSFREEKAIPFRVKVVSVTMVWVTLLYCIFFVVNSLWIHLLYGTPFSAVLISRIPQAFILLIVQFATIALLNKLVVPRLKRIL